MNIEGITLLKQFVTYSTSPAIIFFIATIATIVIFIGALMLKRDNDFGIFAIGCGIICTLIVIAIANEEENNTFINYPAYTHYIVQINNTAAWSEIAPNYIIVEEIYPNTNIYEIKKEYEKGDDLK